MTADTDACQFGCGHTNDDSTVGGPGFALIPACPVHGWVCELLDQSAARLTAAEGERDAARKAWSIESRERSSLLARLTTAEQERDGLSKAWAAQTRRALAAEARVEAAEQAMTNVSMANIALSERLAAIAQAVAGQSSSEVDGGRRVYLVDADAIEAAIVVSARAALACPPQQRGER